MFFYLTIKSKNKNSLNVFLKVFKKLVNQKNLNFTNNKKSIKRLTFLKSPHVNKTAQEHFNFVIFSKFACVKNLQIFKTLMILKKIKNNICCDVVLKIKFFVLKKDSANIFKIGKFFQNEKPILKSIKNDNKRSKFTDKLKIILLNYNFYGKLTSLNSSVGRAKN